MAAGSSKGAKRRRQRRGDADLDGGSPGRPVAFGPFELLGQVGRGGMAYVYRARSSRHPGQLLAVKCLRSSLIGDPRFIEMFDRETRLALMFDHPSIVRTLDTGQIDGTYFIAMEYVPGRDLHVLMRRARLNHRRLPIPHALHISRSIARALHYAHTLRSPQGRPLNIVNRDVSPANIRVSYDGTVKLLDFGIAQAALKSTSEIGVLKGKFAYMSPEQVRGLPVDDRSDLFSLGIIMHEMLTHRRLFVHDSEFAVMERVRQSDIRPPSTHVKQIPQEVDAVVMRALDRDLRQRFTDTKALADEIDAVLARYEFDPSELADLMRTLFIDEYREESALLRKLLPQKETAQTPEPTGDHEAPPKPADIAANRPEPTSIAASISTTSSKAPSHWLIWAMASALLLAGLAMLAVALR